MATKKYFDDNGVLYLWNKIKTNFVLQESGKGLSTNDLTNELKNTYDNVVTKVEELTATGGEPNVIETIKVNNEIQAVTNKTVNIDLSGYATTEDLGFTDGSLEALSEQVSVINTAVNKNIGDISTLNTNLDNKVDKVSGKGLSTNDYTTTEKNKLSGISSGAEVNKIDSIKVNGTAQTISSKAVNITVPTNNNQLTNGAGYQTEAQVKAIVEGVVGSAPDLLNTLDELAQALGDDPNFATTMTTELAKKVNEADLVAITNAEIDTIIAS